MYDHLDDPAPPRVRDETRAAVFARAGQLRRRRAGLLSAGAVAVAVAVAVVAAYALAGQPERASLTVVSPTPTPTPTASAAATASAAPTSVPTLKGPPPTPPARSTAPGTVSCQSLDCPDGRAGWSTGYAKCVPASVAADGSGQPPVDGLVLKLGLPASAPAGGDVRGTATISNNSSDTVSFEVRQPRSGTEAGVQGTGGRSSTHATDAEGTEPFELAPGQSDSIIVVAHTTSCGDTSHDPEPALAPGSYQVGVTITYANAHAQPSPDSATGTQVRSYGTWSVAQSLRIT